MPTWSDATFEERTALMAALDRVKVIIEKDHRPDGYDIGINCGPAAGQTIFDLHVHLIPRYSGDVPNPRGGVRRVIADKANYPKPPAK
jgi:diadenosine tetraphosphate (Ap4A) HIT family hydrolase